MTAEILKPTWTLVMEMLAQLHQLGHQRLRLSCGVAPNGVYWRYSVAPAEQFEANGYLLQRSLYPGVAYGTSNGEKSPFQWPEQEQHADALARRFLASFPAVAAAGRGSDEEYARWFAEAVELSRPDGAIVMYGEYVDAEEEGRFHVTNGSWVGLPPGLRGLGRL